jgi:adenylate cyclase
MPFLNMTADPKQVFFADGLSEGIITALAKVPQLFVIGRDSTFSYKGKSVKAKQVSEELGVQYVLEGSVQNAGDSGRITAQLIDAIKGHQLWAERYDRQLKDVFSVQDEITKKIITALDVQLTHGEWGRIASKGTENLDAYLKSQEAAWCADQDTRESLERGKMLSEEAIALDPKFPHAYHVLGVLHMLEALSGFSKNPRDSLELAIKMQRKAIELDESFAMARAVMGFNLLMLRKYDEAISEAENAYQLMPGSSSVLYWYGTVLTNFGKAQEAVPILQKVLRLEPKPMNSRLRSLSAALRDSRQYKQAIEWIKKAIQKEPDSIVSLLILTSTYAYSGQEKEARAAAKEILRINPKFSIKQLMRANPQRDTVARERFVKALELAGLPD